MKNLRPTVVDEECILEAEYLIQVTYTKQGNTPRDKCDLVHSDVIFIPFGVDNTYLYGYVCLVSMIERCRKLFSIYYGLSVCTWECNWEGN